MSVPSNITDLSIVASTNSPAGSESIGISLDDYLRSHAAFIAQLYASHSSFFCPTVGGTANAITLTTSLALTAYALGQQLVFYPTANNTSGTVKANINTIGDLDIKKSVGNALVVLSVNDIVAGVPAVLQYSSGPSLVLMNPQGEGQGADIASAATLNLDTATGHIVDVTGTTTVTAITLSQGRSRLVRFTGILSLTNGANLILPSGADVTTAAGDYALFVGYAGGVVRCASYQTAPARAYKQLFLPTASVAANAMTVGINPATLDFRSATLTSSASNTRTTTTAVTLTIPSGSTLGAIAGQLTRYAILAIDNGTTFEAAIVNIAGGVNLNEEGVISTTSISGSSNSAGVVYSTTARSNVPYRVAGIVEYTQTTPGTHAAAHSLLVGAGGNALSSMSSIGYGQIWAGWGKSTGVTYYNTTGKPIYLQAQLNTSSSISITISGLTFPAVTTPVTAGAICYSGWIIPVGASYLITLNAGSANYYELK